MLPIAVHRTSARLSPDPARVISRSFALGGIEKVDGKTKVDRIIGRALALEESEVVATLDVLLSRFSLRHRDLRAAFERNYSEVVARIDNPNGITFERRLLIGACFTHEYSIEAAALTNPSIVEAPDQSNLQAGETRFVLSLRAIGEGHISSIEFRSGVVDKKGEVRIEPVSRYVSTAQHRAPIYDKGLISKKLEELSVQKQGVALILSQLPEHFTLRELDNAIDNASEHDEVDSGGGRLTRTLHWLATSNYESTFRQETALSERVLFPAGSMESHGMEDARFVRFLRDDGSVTYFAPYTAYDGYQIMPQLIETDDFLRFRISTLNGSAAKNKGIALFPRMIRGRYFALGRLDNENNFLLSTENVRFWYESQRLQAPSVPWEIVQIGNCGSPLETPAGWLVITHGVGPMRQYTIGAILLDLDDPSRVIGHLTKPLLEASQEEREGYVPNVVYSCGSMIAGEHLVLPYGHSDVGTRIATVRLTELLDRLTGSA